MLTAALLGALQVLGQQSAITHADGLRFAQSSRLQTTIYLDRLVANDVELRARPKPCATHCCRSPIALGFATALAIAVLGSRLLQATGRGRAAAAAKAAASPEAAVEVAAAEAASGAAGEPSDDELLGRGRRASVAASRAAANRAPAAAGGPAAGASQPGGAAAPAQQPAGPSEAAGRQSGGARRYEVGAEAVDTVQWLALPYVATVREGASSRAITVSLLGDEDAILAFEVSACRVCCVSFQTCEQSDSSSCCGVWPSILEG